MARHITKTLLFSLLPLLTLLPTISAQSQTTIENQPGKCSTAISCTLPLTTSSGNISFAAVVGPNCRLGQTCSFPSGYVGTHFAYQLPDGSSADAGNFSGVMTYLGAGSCGSLCGAYYYTISGTFSGQDSEGRAFTGSTQQGLTISSYSRGGDSAMNTGGATTITFTGGSSNRPAGLVFLTAPPSGLTAGESIGTVLVGVEDSGGNTVSSSAAEIAVSLTGPTGFSTVTQTATASNGTASLAIPAALTIAGEYTLSASSTGLSPANTIFAVEPSNSATQAPDFSLTAVPATLAVMTGQSASANVTVVPVGGLTGTQTFACSGLPASMSCSFAPAVLNADGSNTPLATQMTITAGSAATAMLHGEQSRPRSRETGYLLFAALLPGVFFCRGEKKAAPRRLLLITALLTSVIAGLSCGASQPAGKSSRPVTTVAVLTATSSNGMSHSTNIGLTVMQ